MNGVRNAKMDFIDQPNPYGVVMTGVVLAIKYDKGIIAGSDSRTSMGSQVADRCARKINYVSDKIAVLGAGSAADNQILARHVTGYMNLHAIELGEDREPLVYTAAHMYARIIYQNKDYLMSSMIVAGYDNKAGSQIYAVTSGGALVPQEGYYGTGSGMPILTGYLNAHYRPDMSFEEARQLLINAISLSIKRDASSGGSIRISRINKDELVEEFVEFNAIPKWESAYNSVIAAKKVA